jgi:hypothetical protein
LYASSWDYCSTSTLLSERPEYKRFHHRNFVQGGGGSTNSLEDRGQTEQGSGGGSPLVRGSGGSCNLVQEISFHIVKLF